MSSVSSAASAALATGSTRDQILGAARELITTRSYLGFSFQDVADAVGVRKASLYHHFPSKEALGVAVLREAIQGFRRWDEAKARAPREALDAYFRMCRNGLRAGSAVCPAGALTPGWDCIHDELRGTVQELRELQVRWLAGVFGALLPARPAEGGGPDAAALAAYVFAVCQGALLASRMTGRVEDFDEAIAQLRSSLPV
ncbi:TetR/AcrR family transcriptional regulator [Variovorax sp. UC122_21]|uniref:TetR/AcrR family transcriptional regulator n=1 Tax=Variovorax sp. UC122_21 TaxID=3374554 RepID=UPI003757DA99